MKLTDEKILELAEQHGNEYGDWEFSTDSLMSFARAILKEAGTEELERENAKAKHEAGSLAMHLWREYYQDKAPDFKLLDTASGIITQLDNMCAGVRGLNAQEPEGWQLVPKEPTPRMLVDGMAEIDVNCTCEEHATPDQVAHLVYSIMLAEAPKYEEQ